MTTEPESEDRFNEFCRQILALVDEQPRDDWWLAKLHYLRGALGARVLLRERAARGAAARKETDQ